MATEAWIALLLLLLLPGCGDGRKSVQNEQPRFYSASSAATLLLMKLGAGGSLAAVDRYGKLVPGTEGLPADPTLEKLAELGVNRAFVWSYQSPLGERLRQHGIRVETVRPLRIAAYPEFVRTVAAAAGRQEAGEALIAQFHAKLPRRTEAAAPRPRVYFELYSAFRSAGRESWPGDLLELAGADNIGPERNSGPVSPEHVVRSAPEVILCMEGGAAAEEIAARPGFAELPAVVNRRIYTVSRLNVLEGADPAEAVQYLRTLIHRREQ